MLVGTAAGIVTNKLVGGYEEQIRVPPSPGTLQQIAKLSGGQFFRARTTAALTDVYKKLSTRIGHKTQSRQITDLFGVGAAVLLLAGGALSALLVPEARPVRRALVLLAAVGCCGGRGGTGRRDERVPRAAGVRARRRPVGRRDAGPASSSSSPARSGTSSPASTRS